jgi:hypothetical protein
MSSHEYIFFFIGQMYEEPVSDVCILHAQVEAIEGQNCNVELPPFLNVERQLNCQKDDDEKYGAYSISLFAG